MDQLFCGWLHKGINSECWVQDMTRDHEHHLASNLGCNRRTKILLCMDHPPYHLVGWYDSNPARHLIHREEGVDCRAGGIRKWWRRIYRAIRWDGHSQSDEGEGDHCIARFDLLGEQAFHLSVASTDLRRTKFEKSCGEIFCEEQETLRHDEDVEIIWHVINADLEKALGSAFNEGSKDL